MADRSTDARLDRLLDTARRAASAAAAVHSRWAKRIDVLGADTKALGDFVSRVDVEAQEAALGVIRAEWPDHWVMAEEGDAAETALPEDDTPIWIVDPLDGTANFLHDHPNYCASVAVAAEGRVLAGCVHCPPTGERWWARAGGGAFVNGRPIRTSRITQLEHAMVATGFMFRGDQSVDRFAREIVAVRSAGAGIRRDGAAAIDLCHVADGRFEGYWEHWLNPWDFAAGALIVEEAGGRVERRPGEPLTLTPGPIFSVNGPEFAARLSDALNGMR